MSHVLAGKALLNRTVFIPVPKIASNNQIRHHITPGSTLLGQRNIAG